MSVKRTDTRAAVAGLFDRPSTTGGLAGIHEHKETTVGGPATRSDRTREARRTDGGPTHDALAPARSRVRLGVELTEDEVGYLRSLSRPARTGAQRTLGSKFVAGGVLAAAIELLRAGAVDMHGMVAGDVAEMTARARAALIAAAREEPRNELGE
jgi:hypothetical protein